MRSSLVTLTLLHLLLGAVWSQSSSATATGVRAPSGPCEVTKWSLNQFQLRNRRPVPSAQALETRLLSEPKNPHLHHALGLRYEEQRQYVQAIVEYRTALNLDQTLEETQLELASRLFHCRQSSKAVEAITLFVGVNPGSVRGMRLGSLIQIEERKYDQAFIWARQAADLDPDSAHGHHLLGLAHKGLHQITGAVDEFERAIALAPSFPDPCNELGLLYSSDSSTFDLAAERFEKAISLGSDYPEIRKDLGSVLLKLGRHEDALRQLEVALVGNPEMVQAYFVLGSVLRKLGKREEATAALEKFQSLRKTALEKKGAVNQAQAYYEDGMELFAEDQFQEAYVAFSKAIDLLPTLDPAYHRLAQIDFMRGDREGAAARVRRAIELYSMEGEYYFVLARCLGQSDVAGATEAIRKAIDLKPEVAEFHNLLGNLLFAQSDYTGAAPAYRQENWTASFFSSQVSTSD